MTTNIKQVIEILEKHFPLKYQESWDNCGLQIGDINTNVTGILCAIDITEDIVEEAISKNCNLIVTHHPPLFHPIKRLDNSNYINRSIINAIKNNIAIYSAHTSADNSPYGLNFSIAKDLNLKNIEVLSPQNDGLMELVTFVPSKYLEKVSVALFDAGAGNIGNYDKCSFWNDGIGTFRALSGSTPFVGKIGEIHREKEVRLSVVLEKNKKNYILDALKNSHPYEEPAYSFHDISTSSLSFGSGAIGLLHKPIETTKFLYNLKEYFNTENLAHSIIDKDKIVKVAICSGAGAFLHSKAASMSADIFITGEAKYNDYFDAKGGPILVTVGHYESEIISQRIFQSIIIDNFTNFAVHTSGKDINPVKYI